MGLTEWATLLGNFGEFVGAVAVVATLGYLAVQIRANSAIARAESQRELLDITPIMAMTASNPDLVRTIQNGLTDFDSLPRTDQAQFHSWAHIICANCETAFRMQGAGMMERPSYDSFRRTFLGLIVTPGGAQWWQTTQHLWSEDHKCDLNGALQNERDSIVPWTVGMPFFALSD